MTGRFSGVEAVLFLLLTISSSASAQSIDSLISPGELSQAHADLVGIQNCKRCHEPGQGLRDGKCLACHEEIRQRIAADSGLHRDRRTDCSKCHPEHRGREASLVNWEPLQLDHAETGYVLSGYHDGVESCESCHTPDRSVVRRHGKSFLLRSRECVSCHPDPHRGNLGTDCRRCHSEERRFREVDFNHDLAAFPLTGAHREVACAECHGEGRWKGIAFAACRDCHQDRHSPSLGTRCEQCHATEGWTVHGAQQRFHSEGARFVLEGRHLTVPCTSCHPDGRFRGVAFDQCRRCHTADPHAGQFPQDCASCHDVQGFLPAHFDHTRSRFALTGRHESVECRACHPIETRAMADTDGGPAALVRFRPLSLDCAACHPGPHLGQFKQGCESCHTTGGFGLALTLFSHETGSQFPLRGKHASVACGECHRREAGAFPAGNGVAVRFVGLTTTCAGCHRDPHDGQLDLQCARCHDQDHFRPASGFDHARTDFPLDGRHAGLACGRCHPEVKPPGLRPTQSAHVLYRPLAHRCSDCHGDVHQSGGQPDCVQCHTTRSFELAYFNHFRTDFPLLGRHAAAACVRCHEPAVWRQLKVLTFGRRRGLCTDCHQSPHRSDYADCRRCHGFSTWQIEDF